MGEILLVDHFQSPCLKISHCPSVIEIRWNNRAFILSA